MSQDVALTRKEHIQLHRALELPRAIEERMLRLIRQNRVSKWFSGYGQEAIAIGCAWALEERDVILPLHRNLGVWTTRGVPLKPLFCQLMGRAGGYTQGRDRTFHFGLPSHRIIGMISHLGAMLPVACGVGLAAQLSGEGYVVAVFCGEGATREGDFHEACSLAGLWKLPVLFVVENNGYGLSTPASEALPVEDIAQAAAGYGMPGLSIDGNDVLAVVRAVKDAAGRARAGEGPTLLEMKTFRLRGHEEASGTKYVPEELTAAWAKKDPVDRYSSYLADYGVLTKKEIQTARKELAEEVRDASEFALAQPKVESTQEREEVAAFAKSNRELRAPYGPETEKRYIDAINEALHQAMEENNRVLLLGQDVAEYGGVFKASEGLLDRFGHARVRNTPIIESGVLGAALGLALEGYHPIVEMQYADFIACGFNQIVNNLATTHYRWGAPVGVTIRAPYGGNIGAGPFHSQSMEAWFCHTPGLLVVVPSTARDAKGLLLSAIAEPNPVLFFEHKYLYRSVRGPVPDAPFELPLGKACVARPGCDATIVTYGLGVRWALDEADWQAKTRGTEIEIIDLRTLIPWDRDAVNTSVRKTSRLLLLHEATMTAGFGAEVAARVAEESFEFLDAPPVRVAGLDLPVPFSINLETEVFSAQARLRPALEKLLDY